MTISTAVIEQRIVIKWEGRRLYFNSGKWCVMIAGHITRFDLLEEEQAVEMLLEGKNLCSQPVVMKSVCAYEKHDKEMKEIGECRFCGKREGY